MRDGAGRWGRVLLLGGTSEIGLAILAELDLQPGAEVVLAGRNLEALARASLPTGARRTCVHWDATVAGSSEAVVHAATQGGDLDLVIAAAGVLGQQAGSTPLLAQEVATTNFSGLVEALVRLADTLRHQRHGTFVILSSATVIRPRKSNFVYGASKAGLDALSRGLADDLATSGVRVVVVRPAYVHGRMTEGVPVGPMASTPEDVGRAVRRALSGGASIVWVPSRLRLVAPVLRLLPRPLWRRMKG